MKRHVLLLSAVLMTMALSAQVPDNYKTMYAGLAGQSGMTLFNNISSIAATGYSKVSYDGLWTAFQTTDVRSDGKVWDTYSDCDFTYGSDKCGSYNSVCDCYNREHSLPKSWWGGGSNACYSDLFHLMPTDGYVNNQRSNNAFGECSGGKKAGTKARGRLGASTFPGYTSVGTVFEPDDEFKGDFARNYFGMINRYGTTVAFVSGEGGEIFSNTSSNISAANHYGLTAYGVALLMKWHRQDAVSDKETSRNTGIQQTQGNRNPFIDCPVLAEYLWGNKAGQSVALQDLVDCGCADGEGSALEDVPAFPSLTLTALTGELSLSCVPMGATVSVFTASGVLMEMIAADGPEMTISLPAGFYLVVVSRGAEKDALKALVR